MDFEGAGGLDDAGVVGVGVVEFELDFAEPVGEVMVRGYGAEVEGPGVGVLGGDARGTEVVRGVEGSSEGAEDYVWLERAVKGEVEVPKGRWT